MSRFHACWGSVLMASLAAACGTTPSTAPTVASAVSTSATGTVSAARVSGSVAGATSGLAFTTSGVPVGLTVSVPGTSAASSVDATGQFTLSAVPPGAVDLKFTSAAGVNATVAVGTVAAGDALTVKVTVGTTTATVDDKDQVKASGEREVEGVVDTVSTGSFVVAGKTVSTTASTTYSLNGHTGLASDVVTGARVNVKGLATATGVQASTVAITAAAATTTGDGNGNGNTGGGSGGADDTAATEVELTGSVSSKTGTCPALTFVVAGTTFVTSSSTDFQLSCASVANGAAVQVKGTRAANGTVAASRVRGGADDTPAPGTTTEVEITGTVAGKAGACPALSFSVAGTAVVTTSATDFQLACASVVNGTAVEVKGTRAANGTVTATRVKKS